MTLTIPAWVIVSFSAGFLGGVTAILMLFWNASRGR